MIIVTVSLLPPSPEDSLRELHKKIVQAATGIPDYEIKGEDDMIVRFVPDMMSYGLGTEIVIEILDLLSSGRFNRMRNNMAQAIGEVISSTYPKARVICLVLTHDPTHGSWVSAAKQDQKVVGEVNKDAEPERLPQCQHCSTEMVISQKGYRCLNCGHTMSAKQGINELTTEQSPANAT